MVAGHPGLRAHGGQRLGRVPAQAAAVAKRQVGLLQRPGQLAFHAAQLHGVAARFEHSEDAAAGRPLGCSGQLAAQAVDGGADRRGMVREIVVDGDAIGGAAHFHAALDVFEIVAARPRPASGDTSACWAAAIGGQGIELVVDPGQVPLDPPDRPAARQDLETVRFALAPQSRSRPRRSCGPRSSNPCAGPGPGFPPGR